VNTAAVQLYETDFYGWIQNQADSLRIRSLSQRTAAGPYLRPARQ